MITKNRIVAISVLLVVLFWVADTVVDTAFFSHEAFLDELLLKPSGYEIYIRSLVTAFILIPGIIVARAFVRRQQAEADLKRSLSLRLATLESTADGILVVDQAGNISSHNEQFRVMWKIPEALLGSGDDAPVIQSILGQLQNPESFVSKVNDLYSHPEQTSFDTIEFKDGRIFERYSQAQRIEGQPVGRVWSFRDVTERKKAEVRSEAVNDLLHLFAREPTQRTYLDEAAKLIASWSGCRHVGIRLLDAQGQIPYESCLGFSPEFLESENWLSTRIDQCACIRVITGKPEPQDLPYMTGFGSFFTNDSPQLLRDLSAEEQARFRGVCIRSGFASIAISPIRYGDEILGAIHLADEGPGMVPPDAVNFVESMAMFIGEAIHRFSIEDEVRNNYCTQDAINSLLRLTLGDMPLNALLQRTLNLLKDLSWPGFQSKGAVFLVEGTPEVLVMRAHIGLNPVVIESCSHVAFGTCLCGQAAQTRTLQFASCVDGRHTTRCEEMAPHGHYCIPLVSEGKTLGVIVVYLQEGHRQTEREIRFFRSVADVMAGIIVHRQAQSKIIEYEELDKLKANLLSTVSHELRTPLAIIKGYSTMLMVYDERLRREEKLEQVKSIDGAADRLIDLVDRLLDMSRLDAGIFRLDKKPTEIGALIETAVVETQLRSTERHISAEIGENLPLLVIDPKRIRQVLDNIMENAIRYSDKGTKITLRARTIDHQIEITVADQGKGIPAAELEKVFDKMYRLEDRTAQDPKGMGLGLPLCKALMEAHGGRIWLRSVVGKGTAAYLTFPLPPEQGGIDGGL